MTLTTTDIRWREAPKTYGAVCIDNATDGTRCSMPVSWCRQWQTSAMAAPAFWYYCDSHGRDAANRDGMRTDAPPWSNPYAVGSIFHTSWGYDQTNVEFYIVVRETAASVWLEPIGATVRDGRLYPDLESVAARRGTHPEMHRKGKHGVYVRMDYVRHAWPYTGGGQYETYAAGGAGH